MKRRVRRPTSSSPIALALASVRLEGARSRLWRESACREMVTHGNGGLAGRQQTEEQDRC